jgi:NAD/NADP transhydrogenase beta subunit
MGIGLIIDNAGWFALGLVLIALSALTHPPRRRVWMWALPLAILIVLAGALFPGTSGEFPGSTWKAWLAIAALAFGVAAAPWYEASRDRHTRLIDLVRGAAIVLVGSGIAITLLGLIGWEQTTRYIAAWDLRLAAVIGIFIGVWTGLTGLMHWLRLKGTLKATARGSRNQQLAQWAVLVIIVVLGAVAVLYPSMATAPLVLLIVLAIEWAALAALAHPHEDLLTIQARHVGLIGVAIVTLGYVQSSLLLLVIGGLVVAGSIHFVRRQGAFCQISRRRFYTDESADARPSVETESGH